MGVDNLVYESEQRIIPSSTHFMSLEGVKHYCIPTRDTINAAGEPVTYAAYKGEYYILQRTITPFPEPMEFWHSGRSSKGSD